MPRPDVAAFFDPRSWTVQYVVIGHETSISRAIRAKRISFVLKRARHHAANRKRHLKFPIEALSGSAWAQVRPLSTVPSFIVTPSPPERKGRVPELHLWR
jgi:hypothetical protein